MDMPYCKCCVNCNKSRCNGEFQWRCTYLHKWVSPHQTCDGFKAGEYKKIKHKGESNG